MAGEAVQFRAERLDRFNERASRFGRRADLGVQFLEAFKPVGRKSGDFGNRLQLAPDLSRLAPMRPDPRQHSMPGKLPGDVRLALLQGLDPLLDPASLSAELGVLLAERMPGGNLLAQRLLAFQEVGQPAGARRRVQEVASLLFDHGGRLEQLAAGRAEGQPVNVTGHFVPLKRRQLLQFVESHGEHVLEQAFVGPMQQFGQECFGRLLSIHADDRDQPTRSPVGDAADLVLVPLRFDPQQPLPADRPRRPVAKLDGERLESIEHAANESRQGRLAGLVGAVEESQSAAGHGERKLLPDAEPRDLNRLDFHAEGPSPGAVRKSFLPNRCAWAAIAPGSASEASVCRRAAHS